VTRSRYVVNKISVNLWGARVRGKEEGVREFDE
jgi:hypothetical protein